MRKFQVKETKTDSIHSLDDAITVSATDIDRYARMMQSEDLERIAVMIALARREFAESLIGKMLKSLDNTEKINNAAPAEILNSIQKIMKILKDDKTDIGKLINKTIGSKFSISDIANHSK